METASWFGDSHVLSWTESGRRSRDAVVVFRGFPGSPPPGQEGKYAHLAQRRALAEALHADTGRDVHMPHYAGLGKSRGRFTFVSSVEMGAAFAADVAARGYERVHLVGYSWGGLVAVNAARALGARLGRVALVSAVTGLGDDAGVRTFLEPLVRDYPNIFGDFDRAIAGAVADLSEVRDRFNPIALVQEKKTPALDALMVHARGDEDVKVETARRFKDAISARYVELDDDHILTKNWERMLDAVSEFIRK